MEFVNYKIPFTEIPSIDKLADKIAQMEHTTPERIILSHIMITHYPKNSNTFNAHIDAFIIPPQYSAQYFIMVFNFKPELVRKTENGYTKIECPAQDILAQEVVDQGRMISMSGIYLIREETLGELGIKL